MMQFHLACNSERDGRHLGYVEHIHLYGSDLEPMLELHGNRLACSILRSDQSNSRHFFFLCHLRQLRILSYTTWAGNWCWDAVQLSPDDTAKLVNYLKRRGWQCETGWAVMCDLWNDGHVWTAADFSEEVSA